MASSLKLNRDGVRKLLRSPEVGDMLMERADGVVGRARSGAPVVSGDYQRSIEARLDWSNPVRLVARVTADIPYATVVESRERVLGRALGGSDGLVDYVSKSGKKSRITQAQHDNYTRKRR